MASFRHTKASKLIQRFDHWVDFTNSCVVISWVSVSTAICNFAPHFTFASGAKFFNFPLALTINLETCSIDSKVLNWSFLTSTFGSATDTTVERELSETWASRKTELTNPCEARSGIKKTRFFLKAVMTAKSQKDELFRACSFLLLPRTYRFFVNPKRQSATVDYRLVVLFLVACFVTRFWRETTDLNTCSRSVRKLSV